MTLTKEAPQGTLFLVVLQEKVLSWVAMAIATKGSVVLETAFIEDAGNHLAARRKV